MAPFFPAARGVHGIEATGRKRDFRSFFSRVELKGTKLSRDCPSPTAQHQGGQRGLGLGDLCRRGTGAGPGRAKAGPRAQVNTRLEAGSAACASCQLFAALGCDRNREALMGIYLWRQRVPAHGTRRAGSGTPLTSRFLLGLPRPCSCFAVSGHLWGTPTEQICPLP